MPGFLRSTHSTTIHASAAAAVATWVLSMAAEAMASAAHSDPALKPNQPTHSRAAPIMVKTRFDGAMFSVP